MTPSQPRHDAPGRPPLILIAEDDPAAAEMLQILLSNAGYRVRLAEDGQKALARLEEAPLPDALVLDWMLPEISGVDVCRRVRERWDPLSLPILMVTAKADAASKAAAFAAGANDYLTKPFLGAELRARVAAHLRIKHLSEERRAMDEHLMEREKLSTLGLLVSGVAHDLNNPLGGIYGYAQLLLEEESDGDKRSALERIMFDVMRCNRIVSNLLSFARRHAPERTEVRIDEVLARTLELRDRHLQSAGIVPRFFVAPALPIVTGDEHQLQQVFVNILVNAEHALRERGSTLSIVVEPAAGDRPGAAGRLAIRFFNDGPPIPETLLPRIFDPFFTTKAAEEGTGLGLAICLRIVREHGGDIEVSSDRDGTTFTILLPIGTLAEGAGSAPDRRAAPA
jgi:signal transduction histidine kinase